MNATNFYREQHNASVLVWNDTSARFAANWSEACVFKHSVSYSVPFFSTHLRADMRTQGGPTGENLVAGFPNVSASVDTWGLERESYDWKKPGFSEATGHFTQLVWRNTTSVGCGRMNCTGENGTPGWYVVCEYYPQGNIVGDDNQYFKDNVLAQTEGKASDTVESGTTSAGCGFGEMRWGACVLGLAALLGAGIAW